MAERAENGLNEWASSVPNLLKNIHLLSSDEVELAKLLVKEEQSHVFLHWADPGVDDEKKKSFFSQISILNGSYPGGLISYIKNSRRLLADSKTGNNPYDGFTPSVPSGEVITFGDDNFMMLEAVGVKQVCKTVFVLVAGGLGERLGYKGIKLALPSESTTGTSFLQHYIEYILALQDACCRVTQETCLNKIPLVIMTSDDTHAATLDLLRSNSYFGMESTQVKLLKQEKVACLADNDARLALDTKDGYKIQTKPHGHGDVHALLYASGLLSLWKDEGFKWVFFFQDTNALLFKAIAVSLGVISTKGYHVNSLTVPRKAKEAIGGITKLTHTDGRQLVINVEYNQLDPLLRAAGYPEGDVNCETGFSPFPGNINQLIVEMSSYIEELTKTKGAIAEFVNPKYKDSTKTCFKSSTRLECMMQDYPKTLPSSSRVGFTVMDTWLAYAPVKNNPEDASKVPKGNPYHSATSGEMAIYRANSLILKKAGVKVADPVFEMFNNQQVEVWPRITWHPKWGVTFADIRNKISGTCSISQMSTLIIKGKNIFLKDLALDGALIVNSEDDVDDAKVLKVEGSVKNKGWFLQHVDYKDDSVREESRIRGFKIEKNEQFILESK
ncbi:UDP-glucose pyrophosphorylase [Zostera marina]|uniref:UDP-sugar pyrophosphorylase n=1 Tax=Zostera marina TaxID=29655 RepID=A0A0K9PYE8_ZOSMR|nr:UDP-glucose pyrophosphorylase [Zostera marina]